MAVSGDLAVVGRGNAELPGISNAGSFWAYERNLGGTGQWGFRDEYHSSIATYLDRFSASLALRGRVLLVGAPGTLQAVFFVHRDDAGWEEAVVLDLDDTSHTFNDPNYGAAVAFSGLRAVIGAPNSPGPTRWGSVHVWTDISGGGCENPLDGIYCDDFEGDNP